MSPLERVARALCDVVGRDPDEVCIGEGNATGQTWMGWEAMLSDARKVLEAIRDPIDDAIDYLTGDAEAWESGAKGSAHEVYLMHCGKLRRDVAARLRALTEGE